MKAEYVSELIDKVLNLTCYGVHKENNIIVVAEAETTAQLESLSDYILSEFDDVIGVFPTYLSSDEEEALQTRQ